MQFEHRYHGSSAVSNRPDQTRVSFAPDTLREPTFFDGELRAHLAFREAISALNAVVVSDERYQPKDRSAYKAWLAQQEFLDLASLGQQQQSLRARANALQQELTSLQARRGRVQNEFFNARKKYWSYLYKRDYQAWLILDPVITVHPDEVFFECFSKDESSYGRLGVDYQVFDDVGEFSCGTTNIDYSAALYDEFQKIRSYKRTRFQIDPGGFQVQTQGEDDFKEVKIDLPESWVRGFLQVSSAMSLPAVRLDLHPMDLHNICFVLRRHKEKVGPRSLRYLLEPGQPVRVRLDPWDVEIPCPRSSHDCRDSREIRVWGRRRIHILERLIPICKRVTVHLLGTGMPSFYVADLGLLSFTLGLSGWTSNDWSRAGNFDLMAPRASIDSHTQQTVFDALHETWFEDVDALSQRLGLDRATVLGALGAWTQAGRAIYDLNKGVYRVRELTREPLPMHALRFSNEREANAHRFLDRNAVRKVKVRRDPEGQLHLQGQVKDGQKTHTPSLTIDKDERMVSAQCSCYWFSQNKLFKGPCEHMIALRLHHNRSVS